MYNVIVAPEVSVLLVEFAITFASAYGEQCADNFITAYENAVASLRFMPQRGSKKIDYIPDYYRTIPFWKYLWLIYQIDEEPLIVLIDFLIDERSDYGCLID